MDTKFKIQLLLGHLDSNKKYVVMHPWTGEIAIVDGRNHPFVEEFVITETKGNSECWYLRRYMIDNEFIGEL